MSVLIWERVKLGRRLNRLDPFRGPCGLCGGPDARHRVWDSVRGRIKAGDTLKSVAADFAVSIPLARLIVCYTDRTLEAASRAALKPPTTPKGATR